MQDMSGTGYLPWVPADREEDERFPQGNVTTAFAKWSILGYLLQHHWSIPVRYAFRASRPYGTTKRNADTFRRVVWFVAEEGDNCLDCEFALTQAAAKRMLEEHVRPRAGLPSGLRVEKMYARVERIGGLREAPE
jgi:hypothetical protein